MRDFLPKSRHIIGYVVALLFFVIIGSTVATQFNLAAISSLGLAVPLITRLNTTIQDIMGVAPLFGAIFGTGLLIALIVGGLIVRWLPRLRTQIYLSACFLAVIVTLIAMKTTFNITAIAATRGLDGFIALCVVGGLSGYIFAKISRRA